MVSFGKVRQETFLFSDANIVKHPGKCDEIIGIEFHHSLQIRVDWFIKD